MGCGLSCEMRHIRTKISLQDDAADGEARGSGEPWAWACLLVEKKLKRSSGRVRTSGEKRGGRAESVEFWAAGTRRH